MPPISETDKAWMAGLVDTQMRVSGRIHSSGRRQSFEIVGTYSSARNEGVVLEFQSMVGVKMCFQKHGSSTTRAEYWRAPCTEHCPERHQHVEMGNASPYFKVTGTRAYILLFGIKPFMRTWNRAEVFYRQYEESQNWHPRIRPVVNDMHNRGWEIPMPISSMLREL